ncbi:MAG TPA: proline racemase family protein [Stellaceae bacterium]|nr:proline racemase family protein [Stellaceae bacterium]
MGADTYRTLDMHTAGEPVRIVTEGYPAIPGATILEKRRYVRANLDHIRRRLMLEPRGHQDMYGVIRVEPSDPEADLAVLFMHNSGYSTMCGHATVAIGRWAVEHGLVAKRTPLTHFNLECPCGVVRVTVEVSERGIGEVTFESVPAFAAQIDLSVATPSFGRIGLDISFGGAFYAILPASRLKLSMLETPLERLIATAREITAAARAQTVLEHPEAPDLAFLYGTILTDDAAPGSPEPSLNLCIFGEGQVDRSPTGSGVTARLALDHARGRLPIGAKRIFRGLTGEPFSGELLREARAGNRAAVIVRVGGRSYYSGTSTFAVEAEDPLRDGFPMPRTLAEIARK